MKRYIKENVIKLKKDITIEKDGYVTYNPTEEAILEEGWIEYIVPELTEEEKIAMKKKELLNNIDNYDQSDNVNFFYIGDYQVWLDKATRAGLKLRFEAEIASGKTETSLWYNNIQFPLKLENAMKMLYALELYASECYDNTQFHKAAINSLNALESLDGYNYKTGYPDKLQF